MTSPEPKPKFIDLGDHAEDDRIRAIGQAAMTGKRVAFVTDDETGKPERYVAKLRERFPMLVVLGLHKGPVAGTVTVVVSNSESPHD